MLLPGSPWRKRGSGHWRQGWGPRGWGCTKVRHRDRRAWASARQASAVSYHPGLCCHNRPSGLPSWLSGEEFSCRCRRHGFDPRSGKIPYALEQISLCATATTLRSRAWKPQLLSPAPQQERTRKAQEATKIRCSQKEVNTCNENQNSSPQGGHSWEGSGRDLHRPGPVAQPRSCARSCQEGTMSSTACKDLPRAQGAQMVWEMKVSPEVVVLPP